MKIVEEKTREMCGQFVNELEKNLESLGFKNISVYIQNWDGDRIKTTYYLFDSMQKKGWVV
jgi:virulence-associated protein VapD